MINIIEKDGIDLGGRHIFNKGVDCTDKYFEKIYSIKEVRELAEYIRNYRIYDVSNWSDLAGYEIDYKVANSFVKGKKYFVLPVLVAKKDEDEYEHFIPKIRFDKQMVDEYDFDTKLGYGVLNTDNDEVKVICKVIYLGA